MDLTIATNFLTSLPAWAQALTGLAVLALCAALANMIVKQVILRLIQRGLDSAPFAASSRQLDPIARRLANIVPAVVVSRGIELVPHLPPGVIIVTQNVVSAFIVLTIVLAISAALDLMNTLYQRRPDAASRPIKGYVQVAKILLFGASAILIIAVLMDQSPLLLLSGLGAMAAVLMLVFKDTILSLVASVQITSNDMLRVGDWIEMPQLNADGDVIDIALHTVKVQNWDKTVTTIPTHRLISESFINWRAMFESGGRRIKRSLMIDQNSVRFLTQAESQELARFALVRDYLTDKERELAEWNAARSERIAEEVNARRLTNIGTFRAYVAAYLRDRADIDDSMTFLVRQLAPTEAGLPMEIYCFTATTAWAQYEGVQGDVFDHLLAILPEFGLRIFQKPSGMDLRQMSLPQAQNVLERRRGVG